MAPNTLSYAKAGALALLVSAAAGLLALWPVDLAAGLPVLAWSVARAVASVVAAAGLGLFLASGVVILRANLSARGGEDLYLRLNRSRTEEAMAERPEGRFPRFGQRLRQALLPGWIRVGDRFEVRPLAEILATLDADGKLEGLPFQPEMVPWCGRQVRVFRVVDKIYDYGRTKRLKRLPRTVSLAGVRCDGSAHGDCQAGCYHFWKTAWLQPVGAGGPGPDQLLAAAAAPGHPGLRFPTRGADRYYCQFTELSAASSHMHPRDPRLDLRPLLAGNVTLPAFLVALATRWVNRVQAWRGGLRFPFVPSGRVEVTPAADRGLQPGAQVRVESITAIARTLNSRNRNRGLWFDHDMVKFCGQRYRVLRRVERIIDDATGALVPMKTPCIALEGVVATGEYHHFVPQEDPLFWREIWLRPLAPAGAGAMDPPPEKPGGTR